MKRTSGARAWLVYAAVRLVAAVFGMFPIDLNLRTARLLARLWAYILPRHLERARQHLSMAYGSSLSKRRIDRIAHQCLEQQAMWVVEFMSTPRLVTQWTWPRHIRVHRVDELLHLLLRSRGAILLTGHYGNWELTGYLLASLGFDISAVMRPLDNVYLNRYVVRTRAVRGLRLLDKKGAAAECECILRRGGALGFIADQNAGSRGLFVDFFGRPASTYKSIALLAMATEVPVVVGYARRLSPRFRYEVGVQRVIQPAEWRDRPDPLLWITQEYMAEIESIVRAAPEQYLWIHRRWKSQPRNAASRLPTNAVGYEAATVGTAACLATDATQRTRGRGATADETPS